MLVLFGPNPVAISGYVYFHLKNAFYKFHRQVMKRNMQVSELYGTLICKLLL